MYTEAEECLGKKCQVPPVQLGWRAMVGIKKQAKVLSDGSKEVSKSYKRGTL